MYFDPLIHQKVGTWWPIAKHRVIHYGFRRNPENSQGQLVQPIPIGRTIRRFAEIML
jgi:hypothetical protein